jgi:hypothetical protein
MNSPQRFVLLSWLYQKSEVSSQIYECAKRAYECAHGQKLPMLSFIQFYLKTMLKYARYDKSVVIIDILSKKNKFELYDLNDEYLVQELLKILSVA